MWYTVFLGFMMYRKKAFIHCNGRKTVALQGMLDKMFGLVIESLACLLPKSSASILVNIKSYFIMSPNSVNTKPFSLLAWQQYLWCGLKMVSNKLRSCFPTGFETIPVAKDNTDGDKVISVFGNKSKPQSTV